MQRVVIDIPDSKVDFFLELVKNLGFSIEKKEGMKKLTRKQQEFVEGLKDALNDVELHRQGKKKLKTIDQLLDEL
jgi:hypothetical protein